MRVDADSEGINVEEPLNDDSTNVDGVMALEEVDTEFEDCVEPVYVSVKSVDEVGPGELDEFEAELVVLACVGISAEKSEYGELVIVPDDTVDVGESSVTELLNTEDGDAYVSDGTEEAVALVSSLDVDREDVIGDSVETGE
ncbi:hypothetical protein PG991_015348 [Apiospora marii]|uniref:Uncharacterized protein n=1 Tax=Apiospora marii TaxID=335849 RepID=A0ABR1R1J2_9PEZI